MKYSFLCLFALLCIFYSCKKDEPSFEPPVWVPKPPPPPVVRKNIIGWWQGDKLRFNWGSVFVFESKLKYFGADSFYYQVDSYNQGSTSGTWWWDEKDSLHILFNDGYQLPTGQNPFYPVTTPVLTQDSMYFRWTGTDFNFIYHRLDSAMIDSPPLTALTANEGKGSKEDGIPAVEASLVSPDYVVPDKSGTIYFSDGGRIRKIGPDGIIYTVLGKNAAGFAGNGIPVDESLTPGVEGMAFDSKGNLYIAAPNYHMIYKVTPEGMIYHVAGKEGKTGSLGGGFAGDGGLAIDAELNSPIGLTIDGADNIYFSDSKNRRIRKIDTAGIINTIAGTGAREESGDGGPALNAGMFGGLISSDPDGNIYLLASYGIRKITKNTGIITRIAGDGQQGVAGENIPAIQSRFGLLNGITADKWGNVYFGDYLKVHKISPDGKVHTVAGSGIPGIPGIFEYRNNSKHATAYELLRPRGIGIDADGVIYFADRDLQRIFRMK